MKTSTEKFEYRFFTPADFREEQAYLETRHRQGWAFLGVRGFKYHFGMAPKKEMTYERDYKEDDILVDDYTEMYRKDGWEFVFRTDENYYFRKANVVYPEEKEIFSTYTDRAEYFGKLHMRLMSDSFVVVLVALFWVLATIFAGSFEFTTFIDGIAAITGIIFFIFSSAFLVILYLKYRRLQGITPTEAEKQEAEQVAEEEALGAKALEIAVKKAEEAEVKSEPEVKSEAKSKSEPEVKSEAKSKPEVKTKVKPEVKANVAIDNSASVILAAQEKRKAEEKGEKYSFEDTLSNTIK